MKKNYFLLMIPCIVLASCLPEDSSVTALMLGSSSQAPVFLNYKAVSEKEVEFEFSVPVNITSLNFEPEITIASIENGSTVRVQFEEEQEPGRMINFDLLAEDEKRNTVNVIASFRSRNDRMPELLITELRTEYAKPKAEFIEFKTLSAGNLGAMRVFILGNSNASKQTVYEFSPVEVSEGEYIVLHLRTTEEGCIDEYGNNLAESGGTDSSPTARDFWMPGDSKLVQKAATVIYVLDQDDRIISAIMISEKPDTSWPKDYMSEAAEFLFQQGAWKSADGKSGAPMDAVSSAGTTNTRTICRDELVPNTGTAADWYVTVSSGATPGKPNNPKRYEP